MRRVSAAVLLLVTGRVGWEAAVGVTEGGVTWTGLPMTTWR